MNERVEREIGEILSGKELPAVEYQLQWAVGYRAKRAGMPPAGRRDLGGWVARITGTDPKFGLQRAFLGKVFPLRYDKHAQARFDFSGIAVGDLLEFEVRDSRAAVRRELVVVTAIDDTGLCWREAETDDLPAA